MSAAADMPASCARRPAWVRLLPVVVYLLLASQGLGLFMASDDGFYLESAYEMWNLVPRGERHWLSNCGRVLVPISTCLARVVVPSLYWAGMSASVFYGALTVALMAFGWGRNLSLRASVIAALVTATCPAFLRETTSLLPDGCFAALVLLAILQYRRASADRRFHLGWVLVGVWIGLSVLAKQTGILVFPVLAAHAILSARRQGNARCALAPVLAIVLGGFLVFLFSVAFFGWFYGQPFGLLAYPRFEHQRVDRVMDAAMWVRTYDPALSLGHVQTLASRRFGGFGVLMLAAAVAACWARPVRVEAATGLFYLGFLMFGTLSLKGYSQIGPRDRYLVALVPLFAMCLGHWADVLLARIASPRADRPAKGRWATAAAWAVLAGLLAVSAALAALYLPTPFPVWDQVDLVRQAAQDRSRPLFAGESLIRRYGAVLDPETRRALCPLPPPSGLPSRYGLVIDRYRFRDAWNWMPWRHTVAQGLEYRRGWLRALADRLRGRGSGLSSDLWQVYRVEVDMDRPSPSGLTGPPWERPSARPASQAGRPSFSAQGIAP